MIEIRPFASPRSDESPGSSRVLSRLPELTKHEIIRGRVIRPLADQGVLITIKNRQVIARSHVPLEPDQILFLRVDALSPAPILRVLGTTSRRVGVAALLQAAEQNLWRQLFETLGKSTTTGREQQRLKALLEDLASFFGKPPGRESLKDWIGKSGMVWESKIRALILQGRTDSENPVRLVEEDLKGLLGRMTGREEGNLPLVERLLKVIESIQWLNHQGLHQGGRVFFLLPFLFSHGLWSVAQLLIQKDPEKDAGVSRKGKSLRVAVLVELPSFGRVRAELVVEACHVRLAFQVESSSSGDRLKELLPSLIGRLEGKGLRVSEATCEVQNPDSLRQGLVDELAGIGAYAFRTVA